MHTEPQTNTVQDAPIMVVMFSPDGTTPVRYLQIPAQVLEELNQKYGTV